MGNICLASVEVGLWVVVYLTGISHVGLWGGHIFPRGGGCEAFYLPVLCKI